MWASPPGVLLQLQLLLLSPEQAAVVGDAGADGVDGAEVADEGGGVVGERVERPHLCKEGGFGGRQVGVCRRREEEQACENKGCFACVCMGWGAEPSGAASPLRPPG